MWFYNYNIFNYYVVRFTVNGVRGLVTQYCTRYYFTTVLCILGISLNSSNRVGRLYK